MMNGPNPSMPAVSYDRIWRWRVNLPERFGTRCTIIARGTMNSALIEFEDGARFVVSRFAIRKAKGSDDGDKTAAR